MARGAGDEQLRREQVAAPAPRLAPRRAWLVADREVAARLAGYPLLPVNDPAQRRHARLAVLVLGIRAMPAARMGSIADVDLPLDEPSRLALARQLKLSATALDDALARLILVGVIRAADDRPGVGRFAPDVVTDSPVGIEVRWGEVLDRLVEPPRDGSQAALMLFRLLADRVPHPRAAVELSLGEAAADLGLGAEQVRRGVHALVATDCWRAEARSGRASRYAVSPTVLWSPQPLETAAVSVHAAPAAGEPARAAPNDSERTASTAEGGGQQRSPSGWTLVVPEGVQFTLPSNAAGVQVSFDGNGNLLIRIRG